MKLENHQLKKIALGVSLLQAAATEIDPGLADYYNGIGEDPSDIEVMHVTLNLEIAAEAQSRDFVNLFCLGLSLDDFNRAVADLFQVCGQPIFPHY